MRTARVSTCLLTLGLVLGAAAIGCSTADDQGSGGRSWDVVPERAKTPFDQAVRCDQMLGDKAGVREADVKNGLVRWKCGDVDDLQIAVEDPTTGERKFDHRSGQGYGQEYCEYHAVVKGKIIDDSQKPTGPVECVFTSAFSDHSIDGKTLDEAVSTVKSQVGDKPQPEIIAMQDSVNSRGAATSLIRDCEQMARTGDFRDAERQAACGQAFRKLPADKQGPLAEACRGVDLSVDANWKRVLDLNLGVTELKEGPEFELREDVAMCTQVLKINPNKAVAWRNSDPSICGRIMRVTKECGDHFSALPEALQGFSMTSWIDDNDPATPPNAPAGCKYAEVKGAKFQQLLVCTPDPNAVTQAKQAGKFMQEVCKEQFGNLVAMAAPVGAVASRGQSTSAETAFCRDFHAGSKNLKGK